jgi:Coenzyme PQQ synthesis protein D (PqqD)
VTADGDAEREITDGDIFDKCQGLDVNPAPDGYVVHQPDTERVHFLNESAALVFEFCDGKHTVVSIEATFAKAFSASKPPPQSVRDCMSQLLQERLIQLCTPLPSGP